MAMNQFVIVLLAAVANAMSLAPGAKVLVVGNGPIQCLAARLCAIKGYTTTLAVIGTTMSTDEQVVYDNDGEGQYTKDKLPLTIMPITGENIDEKAIETCIAEAEGMIFAFDSSDRTLPELSMNVFLPQEGGTAIKSVSLMSRYCNGGGMGFTVNAAKIAANPDLWAGGKMIPEYKKMESMVNARTKALNAGCTVIRAGNLKGGSTGDQAGGGGGDPRFLNPFFYTLGQQDIVNWRLLYDCNALGVEVSAGDTLPGSGFTAALTATDRIGQGDSHRGAVATALVEALGCEPAKDKDFSIKTTEAREFDSSTATWEKLFASAK